MAWRVRPLPLYHSQAYGRRFESGGLNLDLFTLARIGFFVPVVFYREMIIIRFSLIIFHEIFCLIVSFTATSKLSSLEVGFFFIYAKKKLTIKK